MNCLTYPFDGDYILKKKKSIKRELLASDKDFVEKKIAILGGSTTNDIKLVLELFLLNYGIKPEFYESEYNQFYQDAVFPNAELDGFKPDLVYIHTTNRNITNLPRLNDSAEEVQRVLDAEIDKFKAVWKGLQQKFHCPIIQNNFEYPAWRLLGNKDGSDIHGAVNFVNRLNLAFAEYAQQNEDFFICDINYISSCYGLDKWADLSLWYMYKYALSLSAIPTLAYNVANIVKSILGKNKKAFVLDLDNTLWGGVIGDDGVENIELGPEESMGQAYMEFQSYIKEHEQLGVILNISSKNDYENAIAGLQHPNAVLKQEDFTVIKANWEPKNLNVAEIAKELNILPESMVFVDDNPAEQTIVKEMISGIAVPQVESVENYIRMIDKSGFFETTYISEDDQKRNQMYKENEQRIQAQNTFADYGEYLQSLQMKAVIRGFEELYMARIAQLTNKSNQFNLTTHRYTQAEIQEIAADKQYVTLYGKLEDRFGDNGVVSVVIGKQKGQQCHIDLWLMSCRVLQRNMEHAMFDKLVEVCKQRQMTEIVGFYYKTAKNNMVADFYGKMGFTKLREEENGDSEWCYKIPQEYVWKNNMIEVE